MIHHRLGLLSFETPSKRDGGYRGGNSRTAFIDQILDLQAAERESLAGFAQTRRSTLRLLAIESGIRRHQPRDILSNGGLSIFPRRALPDQAGRSTGSLPQMFQLPASSFSS
jgi:hypothetical protein